MSFIQNRLPRRLLHSLLAMTVLMLGIFNFQFSIFNSVTYAAECIKGDPLGCGPAGVADVEGLFSRILNISVGAAFVALVVVLVVAGIKYITSGGDSKAIGAASQAITWGLLGILFMAIAWLIIQLIAAATGIDALTMFDLQVLPRVTSSPSP